MIGYFDKTQRPDPKTPLKQINSPKLNNKKYHFNDHNVTNKPCVSNQTH